MLSHNSTLRRKHVERRVWWTAFIRDRTLALSAGGFSYSKPVRIKREDFELDIDDDCTKLDSVEDIRMRGSVLAIMEKAKLCWCSGDVLVNRYATTYPQLPIQPPQHITIPQCEPQPSREKPPLYTSTSTTFDPPMFESPEDAEYHIATSSTASIRDSVVTPREVEFDDNVLGAKVEEENIVRRDSLAGGYGVDGEYDDYLEYLRIKEDTARVSGNEEKSENAKGEERDRNTCACQ